MIEIILQNNKSRLVGHRGQIMEIREELKIKAKGYFFNAAYRKRQWDGYVRYITEQTGMFSTGLLDQVIELLKKYEYEYKITDKRELFKDLKLITELGDKTLMGHQLAGVKALLENKIDGVKFTRGILAEATNAGKSLMAAAIYASFAKKRIGLFLVNSKTLFEQAFDDLHAIFPGEVGRVNDKYKEWKRINVCMVQSLGNQIKKSSDYRSKVAKVDILIADEADELIGRKDTKLIMATAYNCTVRVALSGTALKHKDPNKNQEQLAFFGPIVHSITNKELVDDGVSTPPNIKIFWGNREVREKGDYKLEYKDGVMKNKKRHKRIWRIAGWAIAKEKTPILILFKEHQHGDHMLKLCPKEILEENKIEIVNHKTPGRTQIFKDFNDGRIDILLSSMIIKRGKNLPLIKTLINAAGGDSESTILQILGRSLRSHKTKKSVDVIDFYDHGSYLQRHSKHRIRYYKQQQFEVKEIYKKKPLKKKL